MDQLLSEIEGFLYLFWDNIMIHMSNKVKEYLGIHNDRLITRCIPTYSPELNPDELAWDDLKYQELSRISVRRAIHQGRNDAGEDETGHKANKTSIAINSGKLIR